MLHLWVLQGEEGGPEMVRDHCKDRRWGWRNWSLTHSWVKFWRWLSDSRIMINQDKDLLVLASALEHFCQIRPCWGTHDGVLATSHKHLLDWNHRGNLQWCGHFWRRSWVVFSPEEFWSRFVSPCWAIDNKHSVRDSQASSSDQGLFYFFCFFKMVDQRVNLYVDLV